METDILSRHHAEIDDCIVKLLFRADGGDNHDLAAEWNRLEGDRPFRGTAPPDAVPPVASTPTTTGGDR